jgi:ribulose kinase
VRLYYAAAVGIALGTRHIVDALNRHGYDIGVLHLTGGHTANPLLVRLYADATDCTVVLPEEEDSVLLGTAAVAAAGAGLYPSLAEAARGMARPGRRITPAESTRTLYRKEYDRFLLMHEHRRALDAARARN